MLLIGAPANGLPRPCRAAWVLLLAFAAGAACGGGTALDPYDPMTGSGGSDGGTLVRPCASCFEASCAWQTAECASDPECARWLTCARDCGPESGDTPGTACLDGCDQPASLQGERYRDGLASCFEATGGCCGKASPSLDASVPDAAEDSDATTTYVPMECASDGCQGCLEAMKDAKPCVKDDAVCPGLLSACFAESNPNGAPSCWTFLVAYGQCAAGASAPDLDACSVEVPASSVATTEGSLACATRHCPQCVPEPRGACVSCQLAACPDEMRALLRSKAAQDILWCRSGCVGSVDSTACKQACVEGNEEAVPVLSALLACTQQACGTACAGVY